MEGNSFLTSGDLALWDTARTSRAGNYYGDAPCCDRGHYHKGHSGQRATGIALGASALGIAVFGGIAIAAGMNAASKARLRAAENAVAGSNRAIDILAQNALTERQSRETWQNYHAPSIRQYVDVSTSAGAGAGAGAGANAIATAALLNGNNGINSAVGGCSYLRVARVSGSHLCGCDTCEG